jgi:hypothetical protein
MVLGFWRATTRSIRRPPAGTVAVQQPFVNSRGIGNIRAMADMPGVN